MATSAHPTPRFRRLWAIATLLAWGLFALLARHRSDDPVLLGRYSASYAKILAAALAACAAFSIANATAILARIQARWKELLILPASVAVALLGAELILRAFDPVGISYYTEMARYAADRVPDPVLFYRHPRSTTRRYQGVEVRYNEMGLRDDPIAPKADGEFRILVLGDSIAFGWGVAQEQTFPSVLQRLLAAELDRLVRVINSGVCSYNTVVELAWLREHGFQLDPDLILLVYVSNDVALAQEIWSRPEDGDGQHRPFTHFVISLLRKSWLFRLWLHVRLEQPAQSVPGRPGDPGWEASMQALTALAEEAKSRHKGLAAYLWTWQLDESRAALLDAIRDALAPVPVEATTSWFADREPLGRWTNSSIDLHPNADAHARAARRMLESLRDQRLLPARSRPPQTAR